MELSVDVCAFDRGWRGGGGGVRGGVGGGSVRCFYGPFCLFWILFNKRRPGHFPPSQDLKRLSEEINAHGPAAHLAAPLYFAFVEDFLFFFLSLHFTSTPLEAQQTVHVCCHMSRRGKAEGPGECIL